MMASSNLSDHLHQDDLPWPLLPIPPPLHTINGANHEWSQPLMLECGDHFTSDELHQVFSSGQGHNEAVLAPTPHHCSPALVMQELGLQWSNTTTDMSSFLMSQEAPKIKKVLPAEAQPRSQCGALSTSCTGINGIASATAADDSLLLATLESMVLPSINISRSRLPEQLPAAEALEMLASARLCKNLLLQAGSLDSAGMALVRSGHVGYGPGAPVQVLLQRAHGVQGPCFDNYIKAAPLVSSSGAAEARGGGGGMDQHKAAACHVAVSKKPRLESRPVSSFKVRKEKLGDRIAALQQLVAPFGKTDTASVLMEAIGYIKFLQDQVETLSVPYIGASKKKKARTAQGGSKEQKDEPKLDLRSRGLCLVPLSCTSYVTNENGGLWTPPNYRGN